MEATPYYEKENNLQCYGNMIYNEKPTHKNWYTKNPIRLLHIYVLWKDYHVLTFITNVFRRSGISKSVVSRASFIDMQNTPVRGFMLWNADI